MRENSPELRYVQVFPLTGGRSLGRGLTYAVPLAMTGDLVVGSLVRVPIRNRFELGIVEAFQESAPLEFEAKYLAELVHPFPILTKPLIDLARWMSAYYAANLDQVLECMIPAAIRRGMGPKLKAYVALGDVKPDEEALEKLDRRAPQQAKLYEFVKEQFKAVPKATLLKRLKIGASSYRSLVEKGWLKETHESVIRNAYDDEIGEHEIVAASTELSLTEEQQQVVNSHEAALNKKPSL